MLRLALALALAQVGFHAYIASLPLALVDAGWSDGQIGTIMGLAAAVQIVAGLLAGGLIDRYGGRLVFLGGCAAFAAASLLLAVGVASATGPVVALIGVRLLQGIGLAAVLPSALSLVPGLVVATRLATSLALVGAAANISLALAPPVSLAVLDRASLALLAWLTLAAAIASAALVLGFARPEAVLAGPLEGARRLRRLLPAWRSAWAAPIAVTVLYLVHWGVIIGYLPQRADAAGADVGLFFTADALALLALRVPGGYLAGRAGSLLLMLAGLGVTVAAMAILIQSPTTPLLILAGIASGAGAALLIPATTVELSRRSGDEDRGSAFALFSVAFAVGVSLGSLAIAPFIETIGFEVAISIGIAAVLVGVLVVLRDVELRRPQQLPAGAD